MLELPSYRTVVHRIADSQHEAANQLRVDRYFETGSPLSRARSAGTSFSASAGLSGLAVRTCTVTRPNIVLYCERTSRATALRIDSRSCWESTFRKSSSSGENAAAKHAVDQGQPLFVLDERREENRIDLRDLVDHLGDERLQFRHAIFRLAGLLGAARNAFA